MLRLKRSNSDVHVMMVEYTKMIRPVLELSSQVCHYNVRNYLSEEIDALKKHALKIILAAWNFKET